MSEELISKILEAFSKIKEEIDEKGGEFDFRYALADYFLIYALRWTRKEGEGHFKIERDRKDILFYDDSDPPLPVLMVETVNPNEESASHIGKLEGYLKEVGRVKHGILTNGHDFSVYEYERDKIGERINKKLELNIDEIVQRGVANLTNEEKREILQLRIFTKDRFVKFGDVEYFKTYRNDIPLNYELGYDLFIEGLKKSLKELNGVFTQFFNAYEKRTNISGERLREAFENWKKTRVGGEAEPRETFCKETAYILLNRILFTRICEDKGYIPRKVSNGGLITEEWIKVKRRSEDINGWEVKEEREVRCAHCRYGYDDEWKSKADKPKCPQCNSTKHVEEKKPRLKETLKAIEDAFEVAEREYERIYRANIFDWGG